MFISCPMDCQWSLAMSRHVGADVIHITNHSHLISCPLPCSYYLLNWIVFSVVLRRWVD